MNLCILSRELLAVSRKRELYWSRFAVGLLLLAGLGGFGYLFVEQMRARFPDESISLQKAPLILQAVFATLLPAQCFFFLVTTPSLFAGTFPDERRRKTLHYLLQTPLSGFEIVLGKLLAGLTRVIAALLVGLPIVMLLSLFGGLDPVWIVLAYAGTLSTSILVGSFTLMISAGARTSQSVYIVTFSLGYLWLTLTTIGAVTPLASLVPLAFQDWVYLLNEAIAPTNPLSLIRTVTMGRGLRSLPMDLLRMIAFQLGYALVFLLIAGFRVRRAFRRLEDVGPGRRFLGIFRRKPRERLPFWRVRPQCGANPVYWREAWTARVRGWGRIGILFVMLYPLAPAIVELTSAWRGGPVPYRIHEMVMAVGSLYFVWWMIGIACFAAGSIAGECDADTWISLIASPLSGRSIVLSKMAAAVARTRWVLALILLFWAFDLWVGQLHPVGFVLGLIELAIAAWFASAVGIWMSLSIGLGGKYRGKSASQAMAAAFGTLFLFGLAFIALVFPWVYFHRPTPLMFVGIMPVIAMGTLFTWDEWSIILNPLDPSASAFAGAVGTGLSTRFELILTLVLAWAVHLAVAWLFTWVSLVAFDRLAGRPRRRRAGRDPGGAAQRREAALAAQPTGV